MIALKKSIKATFPEKHVYAIGNGTVRFNFMGRLDKGMDYDKMDKIFSGYMNHTDTPADGSRNNMGIGLSVCSTIIKAHGSSIHAENREDGGATFYFALELEEGYEQ